jgi:hypothetical protein
MLYFSYYGGTVTVTVPFMNGQTVGSEYELIRPSGNGDLTIVGETSLDDSVNINNLSSVTATSTSLRTIFLQPYIDDSSDNWNAWGDIDTTQGPLSTASLSVRSATSSSIPVTILGAASQTGDLQQWKNSSATVLASVSSGGGARFTPRVTTITSSATPTINTDNCDAVTITALAAAITSITTNLTGTPNNFDRLTFRIKDNGTARAITWGAKFVAGGVALPTTTVVSKVLTVGFIYDTVKAAWSCVAVAQEV